METLGNWVFVLAPVLYVLIVLGGGIFLNFFFGENAREKWYITVGFILVLPLRIAYNIVGWFVQKRRERLFLQLFFKKWEEENPRKMQALANQRLGQLAASFNYCCSRQTEGLRNHVNSLEQKVLDRNVALGKKAFWRAHNLAHKLGLSVRKTHKDYLPF